MSRVIRSIKGMREAALRWRMLGKRIALVPTMGALHEGHLRLVDKGRAWVGSEGVVVVSIYVNPTQFAPHEDFERYPRTFKNDLKACESRGVDVVFSPETKSVYPGFKESHASTFVVEEALSKLHEGKSRPTFFRGVTTIVAKLFLMVTPDVAVFGAKDFQQARVVQKMVNDLHFPVKVLLIPIVREGDGLAMSSRNRYLTPAQRKSSLVLHRSIVTARKWVRESSAGIPAQSLKRRLNPLFDRTDEVRLDYLDFVHPGTLESVDRVRRGVRMLVAAYVGETRLIDNASL